MMSSFQTIPNSGCSNMKDTTMSGSIEGYAHGLLKFDIVFRHLYLKPSSHQDRGRPYGAIHVLINIYREHLTVTLASMFMYKKHLLMVADKLFRHCSLAIEIDKE
ncbi:hypothetical protein TNCV_2482971 [Trichonephila clavipes]|uniref:Uncharacterized protein n=1 Tax=Trichonephila clavipes TaxID=2585209 RepID=A0A8X6VZF9_TRICX|nr:hypothetical protein TNCV_2482971 [Trichonephila clavipes]